MIKKGEKPSTEELVLKLSELMVPKSYLEYFTVVDVKEYVDRWQIELEEKKNKIPKELEEKGGLVVLDGFCDSIDIVSHCFSLKEVILRVKRRRWKLSKMSKGELSGHYSNTYNLHPEGAKMTHEMVSFLKGEDREIPS